MENKHEILKAFVSVLQMTRMGDDLIDATYDKEREVVLLHFTGGTKVVNVAMDSGAAMILDVMKVVLY